MKTFRGRFGFFKILGVPLYFKKFKNQEQAKIWSKK